jgi:hypothetical protein
MLATASRPLQSAFGVPPERTVTHSRNSGPERP